MTLAQKAGFVVLGTYSLLQNRNTAIPSLCLPALSLSDGPAGLANGLQGVTQFPAAIAVAATFNPSIARAVGQGAAAEARTKGISGVQGTEMNLARVPQSGRIFETYGEDPYLAGVLGVANIEGIQSQGVLDNAKHIGAYTQETARVRLNQIVSSRALAELYDAPFRAAVRQAHVASLMCSYGKVNGTNTCSDPALYATLKGWGFTGFVRSDLGAVSNVASAFRAGIALVKPVSAATVERLVREKKLPVADLNRAVRLVLTQMFRFNLIAHPLTGSPSAIATSPAHNSIALQAAQNSVVLLRNVGSILPLSRRLKSVAVIGTSAGLNPITTGGGSSTVSPPFVVKPLSAIRVALGPKVTVTYQPGGATNLELDKISSFDFINGRPLKGITAIESSVAPGKADLAIVEGQNVNPAVATATTPGIGEGWTRWKAVIIARHSGIYQVTFQQVGDTWLYLDGRQILDSPGLHGRSNASTSVYLVKGHRYAFSARWFAVRNHPQPQLGVLNATPLIHAAVVAAKRADVAIVFASDFNTEGTDRSNLYLPGTQNALIAAVAAANPRTIVVLNTGGAVYMPWLHHVAAVLEAWYPGQMDGAAIARILTGAVNPSGRLPITFPADSSSLPITSAREFPGINSVVNFSSDLEIGYRWYQAHHVAPLFAFGYGLSYTNFTLTKPTVTKDAAGASVQVTLTNVGSRSGADVVQVYVHYPSSTGEPPEQLRAFTRVDLGPGASKRVTFALPARSFQTFQSGSFSIPSGQFGIDIGQSSTDLPLHLSVQFP